MRLEHRVEGPAGGPVLVLSHSLGTTLELWDGEAPALAKRFRVVRYDHRGQGSSEVPDGPYTVAQLADDVLALLDSLQIERFSFCGISLGGAVGMWLAASRPDRVERLVLACTAARFGEPADWQERAALVRREGTEAVAEATLGRWLTPALLRERPEVADRLRRLLLETPREGYAAACEALAEWDFRSELGRIAAPTLVISAAADPSTPPALGEQLRAGIPGARLVVLEGAAHLANVERSDAFTAAVLDHLLGPPEERGMGVRREVLGDAHVDAAIEGTTPFTRDFQQLITRYAWGEIWSRPGLDRKTRSCMTLTALVALGREHELAMHVRAALRNGLTPAELEEVLLQSAVYCGVPAANSAFAIAQRVLGEAGLA